MLLLPLYYVESRIFKNSLYPIIISLIAGNIYRIFHYTFIIPFLEESTTLSTSLPVVGGLWIITAVVALINGILHRRAFSALAEKSGEDNFKKAGEYMFFGGVTTIIFVGIFGFFIGWILAFKGFSSMKRKVK